MQLEDTLKYFKEDFYKQLEQKGAKDALSFYERCNDSGFESAKELADLRRTKEAIDIILPLFESSYTTALGGE